MHNLTVLSGLFVVLAFCLIQPATAQNSIKVVENQVALNFPETVEFGLAANSSTTIEKVTLYYGTNARGCQSGGARQSIQFDPDEEVAVHWEWDLKRSGSLPPGAQVWWEWIINDTDGNELITERQELLIVDNRHQWRSRSRENVTVHWFEGDDVFGEKTLADSIAYLKQLSAQIGVPILEDIQLWIYPTATEVRDAMALSHDWAGAVAFSDYNIMLVSLAPGEDKWAAEVLPHELTHLIVGLASSNCRGGHVPIWLNEGLATYAEGEANPKSLDDLEEALQEERLPPLQSLADGFSAYSGAAGLAYTQSGAIVHYLVESFGSEKMNELMMAIQEGLTIDQALEQVYGFDTNVLDARWRLAQGHAPTPTSAAASAQAAATPTYVPTIVLGGVLTNPTATETPAPPTETLAPASPTSTKIPDVPTETATAEVIAAVHIATLAATSQVPNSAQRNISSVTPYFVIGAATIALATVTILFFLKRKGE